MAVFILGSAEPTYSPAAQICNGDLARTVNYIPQPESNAFVLLHIQCCGTACRTSDACVAPSDVPDRYHCWGHPHGRFRLVQHLEHVDLSHLLHGA